MPQLPLLFNTQNPEITFTGYAWDQSGVQEVIVNGELATGFHPNQEWFFWQKIAYLIEGLNTINFSCCLVSSCLTEYKMGYDQHTRKQSLREK